MTPTQSSSRNRGPRVNVKVKVNERVDVHVAVKLEVWVDVEVLVEVDDPSRRPPDTRSARGRRTGLDDRGMFGRAWPVVAGMTCMAVR